MDEMDLAAPFARMLAASCPPATVRAIERGADYAGVWAEIDASGFLDALVPESAGGAGLSLSEVAPLVQAAARQALPLPVGDTIVARWLFATCGKTAPRAPIRVASSRAALGAGTTIEAADFGLFESEGALFLTPLDGKTDRAASSLVGPAPAGGLRPLVALMRAAAIAGAAGALLEATVRYANERVQFGRPIGKQQAIQQQLALMAEHCVAARVATEIGFASPLPPTIEAVATAKAMTSAAAPLIAATAHAVHGAIGISEECDIQLLTRRLHYWRGSEGSESYWDERLGQARLADTAPSVHWLSGAVGR